MNASATPKDITYSVIVLLEEEHSDFTLHVKSLSRIFQHRGKPFEILIVANGMEGFLHRCMQDLGTSGPEIRAMALNKKVPQATCLQAGFKESRGEILVVCGSYRQISEDSFDRLLDALEPGVDIVSPWRQDRVDPSINQLQSRLFNWVVRKLVGTKLHDLSCSVKVFRRQVLEETVLYGNMYRFLPIIAERKGFKDREIACGHFQEFGPVGFFGISVYFTRIIDILTLYFNTRFTRKPLRFFSAIGFVFFLIGAGGFSYIFFQKIFMDIPIGGRPVFLLSMLFIVIGMQCATVGLLGEIVAFRHGRHQKEYTIEKII